MLATTVILAFALSALGALAEPQGAVSASGDAGSRNSTQKVKAGGVIRGRITSLDTGKPLRRAQVRLASEYDFPGTPRTASTSTDGRYEFRDVAPGRYTLRVERSGYLALTYGQRRSGEQGRPLEIAEQEAADKVDFALPRMSVISGRVLDDLGEPIAGVTVWVLQTRFVQGRRQLVATGANASTDITGRYRLLSLPPGDYVVMGTTRATWPQESDPKQVFGYAPTYFPGTSAAAQARRVKLGVAQEASGIDFNLAAGRTSSVRGHATSASGFPLGGETVTMVHEIGGPTMWMGSAVAVASTKVAADGSWTLSNIPPGEYRLSIRTAARGKDPAQEGQVTISVAGADVEGLSLVAGAGGTVRGEVVTDDGSPLPAGFDRMQVRPPFWAGEYMLAVRFPAASDQPAQEARQSIQVAGMDIDGLVIVTGSGGTVRGQVVSDDGTPVAGLDRLSVRVRPLTWAAPSSTLGGSATGRVNADGTFELKAVVGPAVLSIGTTGDWMLKSVELNGRNLADDPIEVRHGETLTGVRVVLTNQPTHLRGVILDEKKQLADGTVVVFPEETSRWREDSRTVRAARPDQRGEFSIKGLPAGKYLIAAVDYVQDGHWYDPDFLADLRPRAQSLSLAEAESKRIELTVQK